jgi:hypothetical protein
MVAVSEAHDDHLEVTMSPKKLLATLALAGTVAIGGVTAGAGLAGAQDTSTTEAPTTEQSTPPPSTTSSVTFTIDCDKAAERLDRADARVVKAHEVVARLTSKRDELAAKGDDRRAARLTRIIDRVNNRLTDVGGRLDKAHTKLAEVCPAA